MAANRLAIEDYARHIASMPDPWFELAAGMRTYRDEIGSWQFDENPAAPAPLVTYLDSFVRDGPGVRRRRGLA